MDEMESIKQTFFLECEDLLSELESGLLLLNDGGGDLETVNAVFRAVHSIKGGAGAFNLSDVVSFAHTFENVLDNVRSETLEATPDVLSLLLQSSDMLNDLVCAARDGTSWDEAHAEDLLGRLKVLSGEDDSDNHDAEMTSEDFGFQPLGLDLDLGGDFGAPTSKPSYKIEFTPHPALFANGNTVTRLFKNLGLLGEMSVSCDFEALPNFEAYDPDMVYAKWDITLATDSSEEDIQEVFEFAIDDCDLTVTKQISEEGTPSAADPLAAFGLPDLGDLPPLTPSNEAAPDTSDSETPEPPQLPELSQNLSDPSPAPVPEPPVSLDAMVASVVAKPETTPAPENTKAPTKPDAAKPVKRAAPPATIRINLERVDRLINQVGELVINQAMLNECVMDSGLGRDPSVLSGLDEFKQLTRDIQESVMAIRAQPVQPLFQRMSRIVREASQATQKSAKLVMEGEFTEVDKTIVEKLADPLTHMIRNAIDHGLETPDDRIAAGKNSEGTVKLSASHRSGKILIEVSDDGAGINRKRVKSIAVKKGLIAEDAQLTDQEIDNLLFMAGFSTAESVSTLSGRGVGMDVVKRAIQSIGGRISISSTPSKGSTFTITLPLTLAVLDGMLIKVADQTIVVPLTTIVETLLPSADDIHQVSPGYRVINIRGKFIPLIDLRTALNFNTEMKASKSSVVLCIETEEGLQCAISVDSIQDQRQVVIKSLEDNYGNVPCIAAATILGDGSIALILDVDDLVERSNAPQNLTPNPAAIASQMPTQEPAHV
jgi:two-component system chemotaxis sensor kinase CheA